MVCAPILITVYDRLEHLKVCIESLSRSPLAKSTDLIIALDGPKDAVAAEKIEMIFKYCNSITGFKDLLVLRSKQNLGAYQNALAGTRYVLAKYDRFIRTEDDNVFHPDALRYFNSGLERFKNDESIFAICGYNEPVWSQGEVEQGAYLRRGFSSFGFATWSDRRNAVDLESRMFLDQPLRPAKYCNMVRTVGGNVPLGLVASFCKGKIYSDFAMVFHIYAKGMCSVHPKYSLVRNIGQDGSGMNSGENTVLQHQSISGIDENIFEAEIIKCNETASRLRDWHRVPLWKSVIGYLIYINLVLLRRAFRG